MEREPGLSEVRRAELLARLTALDALIVEQVGRTHVATQLGWDLRPFEERLTLLKESRELYFSALKHLLKDFPDDDFSDGRRDTDV